MQEAIVVKGETCTDVVLECRCAGRGEPGTTMSLTRRSARWRYSKSSFERAAAIVEAVSGQDCESYLRRRIFAPAGVMRARFAPEPGHALPTVAAADGTLLRQATAELTTSLPHEIGPRRADGIARGWGCGFVVSGRGAGRFFGHAGGIPGAAQRFGCAPLMVARP